MPTPQALGFEEYGQFSWSKLRLAVCPWTKSGYSCDTAFSDQNR